MFIESIRIENGQVLLEELHLKRIQNTQLEIYGFISITDLNIAIPKELKKDIVKYRLHYEKIITAIEFEIYHPKSIHNLKLVEDNQIDYHLKYADRHCLNDLKEKYTEYSDILITQNGYLTDSSYANIVLHDGYHYFTPNTYLLNGVQRQHLLASGFIKERDIHQDTLQHYHTLFLINAMLDWDNKIPVPISSIDS
ncbi:MAG: aminotransferase class IV [Neisseriaceae bacterium]|nr:chorismate-binding protein [Neisseriaceae bacterium PsAf]MCV2503454.1 aminotransferase class IV [Neisseriaceae bacterium]MCV2509361.1 aminotransferase class IV [Neisseriaceae bacterium]